MGELRLLIPSQLHKELKRKALDKGVSLKQLIIEIFQSYTDEKKVEESQMEREG